MLPPVMLLRVRSKASSTAICTLLGFSLVMRRAIQVIVPIVRPLASST